MIGKERIRGKPPADRTWCLPPRKPLFLRQRAPRLSGTAGRRRHGRGASLPAKSYSFVNGHHVSRGQRAFDEPDVVLHSPQSLIFSSPSTTSTRSSGLRRTGRGASLPAIPYSFVAGHHVSWTQRASGEPDVVLHSPQALILSSPGTTSLGPSGPSAMQTWCFTPRKALFFRPRAPRLSGPAGLRQCGRGASLPAKPYSFVNGHHVSRAQRASGEPDVMLHSPQALILSSPGTTSLGPSGSSAMRTWCFTPRNPLFLRPGAPRPRDPEAHRVPTLKTKAEGNSRPRISLFSPRHRARSVPPQSESTSGPHPFRKCSPFQIRKDVLAEKHLLFSEAHPSHFHKKQKEAAPVVPASYFFPYSKEIPGRLRQGISDCSFPRKTRRRPGGVFRQKFPLLSCRGISVMSSRRDSRRILRMGPPEELLISPSLPTSFPSTGRSLPCRRC